MIGFRYCGKSTDGSLADGIIPGYKLGIAFWGMQESVPGVNRESMDGERTASRPIANEYWTQNEPATFEYSLFKFDGCLPVDITYDEQIMIERWLTSPKFSKHLEILDEDGNVQYIYSGKFLSTEWVASANGFISVNFTFQSDRAYPFKHYTKTFTNGSHNLFCESDELEEYVYPTVTVFDPSYSSTGNTATITNISDDNKQMKMKTLSRVGTVFNCQKCIPYNVGDTGKIGTLVDYSDLGWEDVGDIYWLRLIPGNNQLSISGSSTVTIEYDAPYKKVGGWLDLEL